MIEFIKKVSPFVLAALLVLPVIVHGQFVRPPEHCKIQATTYIRDCPNPGTEAGNNVLFNETYVNGVATDTGIGISGAICCVFSSISLVVNWIFLALIVVSILMGVYGAFEIVTSGGNAEKVETGRKLILYAIIGLVIAFLVRSIPFIARTIIGV
jgi:hypothetical protein